MKDYYKILGLTRYASSDLIRQRFRELASENHPDVSENKNANEVFIEIFITSIGHNFAVKLSYNLGYNYYITTSWIHSGMTSMTPVKVKTSITSSGYLITVQYSFIKKENNNNNLNP